MNLFFYNIKNELKQKFKPFSQLKQEYGIEAIYRTSESQYFSPNEYPKPPLPLLHGNKDIL